MKYLINALPLVADALGRKYGVKVHIGGEKAYTDGKNIHIPALPLEADETALNLARGYLDHEAAHLRITDFEALRKASMSGIERHVWNILEDFMVERKLAAIYPGCAHNFNWLAKHIFANQETANTASPATQVFDWILISLRSLAVAKLEKEKSHLEDAINRAYPALLPELEPLLKAVPQRSHNTADCIVMAKELVELIHKYVAAHQEPGVENYQDGEKRHKHGEKEDDIGKNPQKEACESTKNSDNEGHASGEQEMGETAKNGKPHDSTQTCSVKDGDCENKLKEDCKLSALKKILADPTSMAESDMGALAGHLLEEMGQGVSVNNLEVAVPVKTLNAALTQEEMSEIRARTSALRTRLDALLQSKVLWRNHIGRSGRIATGRIARLSAGDPRVFARRNERQGINTAIHILLDASGSMREKDKITLACNACYAVADVLHKIPGVSVAVTSFPNGASLDSSGDSLTWTTVCPILSCKQKFHNHFQVRPNGSTPMASALWWVLQQMRPLSEKRKILVILSDGEPDSLEETLNALTAHRACGHEVYGIGIATTAIRKLVRDEKCAAIFDLTELASAMFELLQPALLNRTGGRP